MWLLFPGCCVQIHNQYRNTANSNFQSKVPGGRLCGSVLLVQAWHTFYCDPQAEKISMPFAQCERCMLTVYVNISQGAHHITHVQVSGGGTAYQALCNSEAMEWCVILKLPCSSIKFISWHRKKRKKDRNRVRREHLVYKKYLLRKALLSAHEFINRPAAILKISSANQIPHCKYNQ